MRRRPDQPGLTRRPGSLPEFDKRITILEQVTNTLQHNGFRALLSREVYSRRLGNQPRGLLFFWSVPRRVENRARGDSLSVMSVLDLSNFAGLAAIGLLTTNIALGLLISMKYNPVRSWPGRKINTVRLHNWTGYSALLMALVHPGLLLILSTPVFRLVDILWPVDAPKQPLINLLGALALYVLIFVVTTSVLWQEGHAMSRRLWKKLHFATYAMYPLYAVHAIFTDPALKDRPVDWIDAEKVFVEACVLGVAAGIVYRIKWQRRQPPARVHRARTL